MRATHSTKDSNVRSTWYGNPLVWAAIAVLSFILAPNWRDLRADAAHGQQRGSAIEIPASSTASPDETSVPAASSVFTERSYLAVEHVQAF